MSLAMSIYKQNKKSMEDFGPNSEFVQQDFFSRVWTLVQKNDFKDPFF